MPDKYRNYEDLAAHEREEEDFRVLCRVVLSPCAIVAPHGGGIEPGTSEIADAVAGNDFSFYSFEGLKAEGNGDLHITSTQFDEPRCLALVAQTRTVVTIHGRNEEDRIVFLGGLADALKSRISAALDEAGFRASHHDEPSFQGLNPENICNRGAFGVGVQLEISRGLRRTLFESLGAQGRKFRTPRFAIFTEAIRSVLLSGTEPATGTKKGTGHLSEAK